VLVDISGLGLDDVTVGDGLGHPTPLLRLGAAVSQRRLELDPMIATAALAHADPAAELPAVAVALGGSVTAVGPAGARHLSCAALGDGIFSTTLAADEILTEIRFPVAGSSHGAAWCEWAPRSHDFAEAGVGVAVDLDDEGRCVSIGAAACAVSSVPLDLGEALRALGLLGAVALTPELLSDVHAAVVHAASAAGEDRAALTGLLCARAVRLAFARADRSGGTT
jgi:carbon-monoxide dehydrogenase medium subunit